MKERTRALGALTSGFDKNKIESANEAFCPILQILAVATAKLFISGDGSIFDLKHRFVRRKVSDLGISSRGPS